ncbi:tRNA-dihydrouridine synthase [Leptospira sp. 2 VSF19]|uniref:tRNA-dihydrouridine synthase n=1 Tax=Leptospira soteropolitanensis TaxID=2950025 RepID=A0AAW5VNJ7_9LEPT|nr:tRNA-dihydrouridine synthase [Leptospira soteropolitanensis]MCW7493999.1 tRNA-dihydrouridine synthase [Leptospira soteropolitanensis]MCW7501735.1 tRNA-dihydrouridine synthase [Leptospira soteropolitanensis]MCW7523845.1 tRNA-dihydrouridine synthase [Leptospira soteropolitanensis]MCW7527710.1 tRNA-dihydrouridine synthase [Leptospira soteropolitanensis]MCW7531705.1 tRNA-dihydrouridine synthase [Leptospira soteropolitanensis]
MRILLAPMEGLLDFRLRDTLTRVGGFDECVSEFIRVNNTLLPSHRFYRYVPELHENCRTRSGVPVKVQLLGSDINCMAENASKVASLGAYGIDINFGCPAPTVNRNRGGAALLKEPDLMFAIVKAIRKAVTANIPVTAKMRLGYDSTEQALVCAKALEEGGAEEIVVHARTKTDGYKPPAYWDWISKIRSTVNVPVVANGEIWTAEDAKRCQEVSGCRDIMIGRGAVANPALALMIRGKRNQNLSWDEIKEILYLYWLNLEKTVDTRSRGGRIKQWLHYLSREYQEAKRDFEIVKRFTNLDEFTFYWKQGR